MARKTNPTETETDTTDTKREYRRTERTLTTASLITVEEPTPEEMVAARRNARSEVQSMFDELVSTSTLGVARAISVEPENVPDATSRLKSAGRYLGLSVTVKAGATAGRLLFTDKETKHRANKDAE